jgi:uncharacterized pyridoxamine 5'-phosphate oxidase family protein
LQFIRTKRYAVISTCGSNNQPEAALIGFGTTENIELIFGTYSSSRKYKNIKENDKVALVIGWDEDYITVQYEGIAKEVTGEELEPLISEFYAQVPEAVVYKNHPEQTYFKVSPKWIRYADGPQENISEVTF